MPAYTVTKNIDINKSSENTLSIRLTTDGFSFAIFNPVGNNLFFERKEIDPVISLTANIKKIVKETDYLHTSYKHSTILLESKRFTLVPLEIFDEESVETFFYYNHNFRENETICYHILGKNNMVTLFGIDKSTYNFLTDKYQSITFYSQLSILIEHFVSIAKNQINKTMFVYVKRNSMDLFCFDRGAMLLANTFDCKEDTDRQYYILYTWKQLGFDQQVDKLNLIGTSPFVERLNKNLSRFIKEISIVKPSTEVPFDMDILLSYNS